MSAAAQPIVAFLTDFGNRDDYVGQMHAAVYHHAPHAHIIDLCHHVPPGDITAGAFLLETTIGRLPAGTVVAAIVDPGVGSARSIVAVAWQKRYVLAPDNGLITGLLNTGDAEVRTLGREDWFAAAVSNTFHGRDIFAPAAARLAGGEGFPDIGALCGDCIKLPGYAPYRREEVVYGHVRWIDHFGNCITDVPQSWTTDVDTITVGRHSAKRIRSFFEGEKEALHWLIGSRNTVELVVNQGDAAKAFGISHHDEVYALKSKT